MSATRIWANFKELLDVSWGSITDGQTLKRSGGNIIGYTPAGGSGDVVGPASAVSGNVASYSGTTGKLIADSGKVAANLVAGPASATSGRIASYGDTSGKVIADGGKLAADVVTGPASATTGRIASYGDATGKVIADGAKLAADLVTGPASATGGNIATYNGATGKIIQDSARPVTDIVLGQASAVDSEMALFSGTGGKTIKRATGTGIVTVTNGVYQTPLDATGSVVQYVEVSNTSTSQSGLIIPLDDTIPQNTEGGAVASLNLTITPRFSTSRIVLSFYAMVSNSVTGAATIVAIFRDSAANAVATGFISMPGTNYMVPLIIRSSDVPGAGTFVYSVRLGTSGSSQVAYLNSNGGIGRFFGGSTKIIFSATEVKA